MKSTEFNKYYEEFESRRSEFENLQYIGMNTLKKAISKSGIKVHSFAGRVKSFDSSLTKVINKNIEKPFEGIKDFVGLRVVCLLLSDLDKIGKVIEQTFEVVEREDKINNSINDVFGYMGIHFIVKLKEKPEISDIPVEIQLRTIAQDAWASVSHHLDYKNIDPIPDELKRDFYALSGLFYVADVHFSFLEQKSIK